MMSFILAVLQELEFPFNLLVTESQLFQGCPFPLGSEGWETFLGFVGARPDETKCDGSASCCNVVQCWGILFNKTIVLGLRGAGASPQCQTTSFLAGCANPGPAVYSIQNVFGIKGDVDIKTCVRKCKISQR